MARQSGAQRKTVGRIMHEYKRAELESSTGRKVRNPRQAIAIGLSEACASRKQSPGQKRRAQSRTQKREAKGRTAAQNGRTAKRRGSGPTRAELCSRRPGAASKAALA